MVSKDLGIINYGLQGVLVGCAALAARGLTRGPNSAVGSVKAPLGAMLGAYILDRIDYENVSLSTRLVRSAVPAITSGLTANIVTRDGESFKARDGAYVLAAGAAGQIFARKFVRPEYA